MLGPGRSISRQHLSSRSPFLRNPFPPKSLFSESYGGFRPFWLEVTPVATAGTCPARFAQEISSCASGGAAVLLSFEIRQQLTKLCRLDDSEALSVRRTLFLPFTAVDFGFVCTTVPANATRRAGAVSCRLICRRFCSGPPLITGCTHQV